MKRLASIVICLGLASCGGEGGGAVHSDVPRKIEPAAEYLFFLGGAGAADADRKTAEALAKKNLQVIAPPRKESDDADLFALDVKEKIRQMLARGVPGNHIAIAGIGDGGRLTLLAMALLRDPGISFVVVDACPAPESADYQAVQRIATLNTPLMEGRLLSINSGQNSCSIILDKATAAETWEIEINGVRAADPAALWIGELMAWITG